VATFSTVEEARGIGGELYWVGERERSEIINKAAA